MIKGINSLLSNPSFSNSMVGKALLAKPLGFIDVGARGGIHTLVEPLAGVTAVLAFDADEIECTRLQNELSKTTPFAALRILPVALSDTEGSATLYQFISPVNDSLRPENTLAVQRYRIKTCERIGTVQLKTKTLDSVLFDDNNLLDTFGEFIKLDTQGMDLNILQGALRTLDERTVAMVVETSFFPEYEGQPMFSEVELFLRALGFFFYGFEGLHYRSSYPMNKLTEEGKERLFWADAIFFKDPLSVGFEHKHLTERGSYALFVCALLTGYYDFALEIALKTWAKGAEAERIEKLIRQVVAFPPEETYQELLRLVDRVKNNPERANFEVGRFVDNRRYLNDYDNVPPFRKF